MALTLSAIATALTAVSSAVKASEVIYTAGAQLIQVAETAYASASSAGATKKAAVLAALEALAKDLGTEWSTISAEVSSWIDMVIQTWNVVKNIGATPVVPLAPVADVPASQQTL